VRSSTATPTTSVCTRRWSWGPRSCSACTSTMWCRWGTRRGSGLGVGGWERGVSGAVV